MLARHGVIVSHDRKEFKREVGTIYGEGTQDAVLVASLPPDERLHVELHRQQLDDDD